MTDEYFSIGDDGHCIISPDGTHSITFTPTFFWYESECYDATVLTKIVSDLLNRLFSGEIPNLKFEDYLGEEE